jgi:hypothetical protein
MLSASELDYDREAFRIKRFNVDDNGRTIAKDEEIMGRKIMSLLKINSLYIRENLGYIACCVKNDKLSNVILIADQDNVDAIAMYALVMHKLKIALITRGTKVCTMIRNCCVDMDINTQLIKTQLDNCMPQFIHRKLKEAFPRSKIRRTFLISHDNDGILREHGNKIARELTQVKKCTIIRINWRGNYLTDPVDFRQFMLNIPSETREKLFLEIDLCGLYSHGYWSNEIIDQYLGLGFRGVFLYISDSEHRAGTQRYSSCSVGKGCIGNDILSAAIIIAKRNDILLLVDQ